MKKETIRKYLRKHQFKKNTFQTSSSSTCCYKKISEQIYQFYFFLKIEIRQEFSRVSISTIFVSVSLKKYVFARSLKENSFEDFLDMIKTSTFLISWKHKNYSFYQNIIEFANIVKNQFENYAEFRSQIKTFMNLTFFWKMCIKL